MRTCLLGSLFFKKCHVIHRSAVSFFISYYFCIYFSSMKNFLIPSKKNLFNSRRHVRNSHSNYCKSKMTAEFFHSQNTCENMSIYQDCDDCYILTCNNWNLKRYTQRNLFEILLNQTDIRLYLPFSDWFGSKSTDFRLVPNQSENVKYNLILGWFNKISKRFICVHINRL